MEGSVNHDGPPETEESLFDDCERKELVGSSTDSCAKEPVDKYKAVYFLFYFYGVTSMIPWTFFVTANDYWMYKFRDVTPHNNSFGVGKTEFQAEFTSYLNIASCVPITFCLIINSLYSHFIPLSIRIAGSMFLVIIFFILSTVLVQINTDDWQNQFFIITMVTVIVINSAGAIFGGSIMGIAGKFPSQYMAAVINGQALSGIIAAVAQILSLTFKVSPTHSALIYFIIGDLLMVLSFISYFFLIKIKYFTYHVYGDCHEMGVSANNRVMHVSNVRILRKIFIYSLSVILLFFTTTSVYPGVTVLVESHHSGAGGNWNTVFFVPVVNYLIYNSGDYAGRVIAGIVLKPEKKAWIVCVLSVVRVLMIPLLMMCNAHPRSHLPIIISSDWEYIILITIFAFSNGYIANISMINAARIVDHHEKERASSLMAASLGIGIITGATTGIVFVKSL